VASRSVSRDRAADVGEELLEAARTVKRFADHQQRPCLTDDVDGAFDRAITQAHFVEAGWAGLPRDQEQRKALEHDSSV
jgi:hypothetical protein